ncbi:aldehyde dehydrogenase family protein [Streptomyces sp. HGB0020]|uniref:aldehyde dehydrogenase family protein n=1 Tax=Streptomyces sp. HGB0020 TaxID=1078086 RepID=UPI0018F88394|nr:aldehyde dehydrogenase family protein [Streptomyces sp. HGB0020]
MPRTRRRWSSRCRRDCSSPGRWRESSTATSLVVEDLSLGAPLARVADASVEDGVAALDAATAAAADWARTPARERGEVLRRAFEMVTARIEEFALLITLEMGKPHAESRAEVTYGAEFLRWFSEEAPRIAGRYGVSPVGGTRLVTTKRP